MRLWLAAFAALPTLVAPIACGPSAPVPAAPNLLLITIDTLRADRLVCYGGPAGVGERICGIFDRGVRYRWAFSAAPYTAPSIASLLTSRYPAYHGVTQAAVSFLEGRVTTVAEVLKREGYTTAAFVSNPVLDRSRHLGQGFDVYDQEMTRTERNRPGYAERAAADTTDAVLAWAETALREPWFVWVHYQDPHGPYEPPNAIRRSDPPDAPRLPVLDIQSGKGGIPAYQALPGVFAAPTYEQRYLDEIAYLDAHVARLVEGLEAMGRPAEILLTSDHGEAFGEDDYYFAHGHSLGLDQIRVPLLYRAARPDVPPSAAARVVDTPVSLIDVAPTLVALAEIAIPPGYQGRVLPETRVGVATRAEPGIERVVFAEHGRRAAAIRGNRFYSRNRQSDGEGRHRELGQELPWLPSRTAELGDQPELPPYRSLPDDAVDPLELPLSGFLERTRDRRGVRHEQVSNEVLERMRALGYVEE